MSSVRKPAKFVMEDFNLPGKSQIQHLEDLISKLKIDNKDLAAILYRSDIDVLLRAKNRRHPDYFHGIYIDGGEENDFVTGKSQKLVQVANDIYQGKMPRTQIIYRSNFVGKHYFSFDIQLNKDKSLSIFTIDSALENCQSKVIDALSANLTRLNIPHNNYGSRAMFQSDRTSCAFYAYQFLSELAKHDNFHESLISLPQVLEPPLQADSKRTPYSVISKVKWILHSAMPLKIITMTQSYTGMREFLLESKMDKDQAEKIVNDCKDKQDQVGKKRYYSDNRKKNVMKSLEFPMWSFYKLQGNPVLNVLSFFKSKQRSLGKKYILTSMKSMSFAAKIHSILAAADAFFKPENFELGLEFKYGLITDLRDALVEVLKSDDRDQPVKCALPKNILIDCKFDFIFEASDIDSGCSRYRKVVDSLVKSPIDQILLAPYEREQKICNDLIKTYGFENFNYLCRTASQFHVSGKFYTDKIAKQILRLSDEQLAHFFEKFPNNYALKKLKDVAVYLRDSLFNVEGSDSQEVKIIREQIAPLNIEMPKPKK